MQGPQEPLLGHQSLPHREPPWDAAQAPLPTIWSQGQGWGAEQLFPAPPAGPMVTAAQEGASARSTGDQRWGPFAVAAGPQGTEDAQSAHGQHPPGAGEDPRLGASRTTAEGQGRQGSRRLVRGRAVAWMAQHPYKVTSFIRPVIHSANSAGNQHNLCANNT